MKELPRRVATAAVTLPALVLLILWAPPRAVEAVVAIAVLAGLAEFYALLRAGGVEPFRLTGLLLTVAVFLEVSRGESVRGGLWPLVALAVLLAALARGGTDLKGALAAAGGTLLAVVYLGGLGGTLAGLRTLEPEGLGSLRLLLLLAVAMAADTFAFFGGHALGRRPLAPRLSPSKTVEGAVFGLLGGIVGAFALRAAGLELPWRHALVLGLLVAGAGAAGDLSESLVKRWAGVKDSGRLFPGHGGMLDRLDSLLFGAPVLYYYFVNVAP